MCSVSNLNGEHPIFQILSTKSIRFNAVPVPAVPSLPNANANATVPPTVSNVSIQALAASHHLHPSPLQPSLYQVHRIPATNYTSATSSPSPAQAPTFRSQRQVRRLQHQYPSVISTSVLSVSVPMPASTVSTLGTPSPIGASASRLNTRHTVSTPQLLTSVLAISSDSSMLSMPSTRSDTRLAPTDHLNAGSSCLTAPPVPSHHYDLSHTSCSHLNTVPITLYNPSHRCLIINPAASPAWPSLPQCSRVTHPQLS